MMDVLWLLLPVAAASGWFAARHRRDGRGGARGRRGLSAEYFKGINYLLNEQPDKAIEVFIKVLEVDSETVETHLALGNLYRRRGEVDRAIRIHQNLVARASIDDEQRFEALLELAQDYLSAGLLDRAENLFRELVEAGNFKVQALRQLIDIYEQEKDWERAAQAARDLESATGSQLGNVVSQYLCEQAEQAREAGRNGDALALLEAAREAYRPCARASIIEGDILAARGDTEAAVAAYRRVESQEPDYVSEVVERTRRCLAAAGEPERTRAYLADVLERFGGITATLALAEVTHEEKGGAEAIEFIMQKLKERPTIRGLDRLLELEIPDGVPGNGARSSLPARLVAERSGVLKSLTSSLLEDRPVYKCEHCGFPAKLLHWRCPGCKHWNSVRPIHGVDGE